MKDGKADGHCCTPGMPAERDSADTPVIEHRDCSSDEKTGNREDPQGEDQGFSQDHGIGDLFEHNDPSSRFNVHDTAQVRVHNILVIVDTGFTEDPAPALPGGDDLGRVDVRDLDPVGRVVDA